MPSLKRILVTGGAGFLGSHLCERLLENGHDVICLDNFFTSQKSNVAHLLVRPNFELIRHDVTLPIFLEVDEIYNLACPAAPGHYQYNPIKTMKTSVMGAINVLGMAKRCRAKVLQASTSEVYGDPDVHPQPESYRGVVNPIGPRACYDEGKRAAETLFMDYHRQNRVNIRIVRIFNTYGPRMHPYRRPRGVELHPPGAGRRRHHDLRRRLANPLLLLPRRPDRRHDPHDGRPGRFRRAGEPRQPRRVHDPGTGRAGAGADRLAVEAGLRVRCRSTIRRSGSPTSRWPRSISAGVPRFRSAKGCRRRSSGSARSI